MMGCGADRRDQAWRRLDQGLARDRRRPQGVGQRLAEPGLSGCCCPCVLRGATQQRRSFRIANAGPRQRDLDAAHWRVHGVGAREHWRRSRGKAGQVQRQPDVDLIGQLPRSRLARSSRDEPAYARSSECGAVLSEINKVFSDRYINIAAQSLRTRGEVEYLVIDIYSEDLDLALALAKLAYVQGTLRSRVLFCAGPKR